MMNWTKNTEQSAQRNPETGASSSNVRLMAYAAPPYQQLEMRGVPASSFRAPPTHLPYQQAHQFHPQLQERQILQAFWAERVQEIDRATDFKSHSLPITRVKRVMKNKGEAKFVSSEAPILMTKACELLIQELTARAWMNAVEKRQTKIAKSNLAAAVAGNDEFDFLAHIFPRGASNEGVRIPRAAEPMPYPPTQHQVGAPQPHPQAYMPWQFSASPRPPPAEAAYVPWQFSQPQSAHVSAARNAPPGAYLPWQFSQQEPARVSAAPQPPPGDYMPWQFSQPQPMYVPAAAGSSSGAFVPWQFPQPQPTQQPEEEEEEQQE